MRIVAQRLAQLVVVLVAVTFLTSLLINLLEGDPALTLAGGNPTPQRLEQIREELYLDDNAVVRYGKWMRDVVVDQDLGRSYVSNTQVSTLIGNTLPVTLQLMLYAQILSLVLAIPLGVLTAYRQNSWFDKTANTTAFGMLSVPNFILGVVLVYVFALQLGWFPATRVEPFRSDPYEHFRSMVLPSLTLALGQVAVYMRLLRTDMIATLQEDYISTARAKGMPTWHILLKHALRPSSLSLITVIGLNVGQLIGGTVIVEQIFGINGMGRTIVFAIAQRDLLVVQGTVVVIAVGFVLVNFAVDILYSFLDPRIRRARAAA